MPLTTFLGAPIRRRGTRMGNFYLGEKGGDWEFTDEDVETRVMFANRRASASPTPGSITRNNGRVPTKRRR